MPSVEHVSAAAWDDGRIPPRPLGEVTAGRAFEVHSVYGDAAMLRRILRLDLLEGAGSR